MGYFGYFGARVGSAGKAYYSYDVGDWHVVSLDSDCGSASEWFRDGQVNPEQIAWLESDLAAHPGVGTLAYWHHPLFYDAGSYPGVKPLWDALLAAHADVVLNGHLRYYERFARQDAAGVADAGGLREFIVGTGGKGFMPLTGAPPNKEAANANAFGVLFLTLHSGGYDWRFQSTHGTAPDASSSPTACNRAATTTTLTATPAPASPSDPVALDATLQRTATGDVTFTLDGTVVGSAPIDSGHARFSAAAAGPGRASRRSVVRGQQHHAAQCERAHRGERRSGRSGRRRGRGRRRQHDGLLVAVVRCHRVSGAARRVAGRLDRGDDARRRRAGQRHDLPLHRDRDGPRR